MPKPQQPEIRRSERGAVDDSSVTEALTAREVPGTSGAPGAVPEDNQPGHHPEQEQDKPVARFRRRAVRVAEEAHEDQLRTRDREIEVGELSFDALEAGREAGELVLLLHGFPQPASVWRPQLAALARHGFHAVAPDQRGYSPGARPGSARDYRLSELVRDTLGMADRLGARRLHLVGHDWGGMVGWAVAAAAPHRLRSLTVVSTPHPRALATSLLRSTQLLRSGYIGFFNLPAVPELLLGAGGGTVLRLALARSGLPGRVAREYVDELRARGALGPALNWYRALPFSLIQPVGRIEVPTTYVWSDGDVALGGTAARASGSQVRAPYRFEVMPGVSHWIPETAPDDLTRLILEQVSSASDDSAAAAG